MDDSTHRMLTLLGAAGPHPRFAERLMLYGRLVGSWEIENRYFSPSDGRWLTVSGEWHFGWILDGYAIQDVIIFPAPAGGDTGGLGDGGRGTTIRWYDPRIEAWRIVFFGPAELEYATLVGRAVGADIVQEGVAENGARFRWVFSDLAADSFRWQGHRSDDHGATWRLVQEMQARRRG